MTSWNYFLRRRRNVMNFVKSWSCTMAYQWTERWRCCVTILVPPLFKLLLTSYKEHRGSKVLNVLSPPPYFVIIPKPFGPHLQYLLEGKWMYTFDPIQTPYSKGWSWNLLQRTLFYRQELWAVKVLSCPLPELERGGKNKKARITEASLSIQIQTLLPKESCSKARG